MKLRPVPLAVIALWTLLGSVHPNPAQTPAETPVAGSKESIEQLVSEGKLDEAVAACTRRIHSDPHDAEALAARADAYDSLHLPALADADRDSILKIAPAAEEQLSECAEHYFALARFAEAIRDLDAVLRFNPANVEAVRRRADCHNALEHYEPAVADFTRALELIHDNDARAVILYCRAQLQYGHLRFEESLADNEAAEAAGMNCTVERADCLERLHRWKESEALYWEILHAPDDAPYNHGGLRAQLQPMPSAKGSDTSEGNEETRYNALRGHAVVCAHLGRFDTAESDLAEAFALQPKSIDAYGTASWTRLFAGKLAEARDAALKALEIDPTQDWAFVNLAHTYLLSGHFDWARSLYLDGLRKPEPGAQSRIEMALEDFAELRAAGIDHPDLARMEELLRRQVAPAPAGTP